MSFNRKLNEALNRLLREDPLDYTSDWEQFRSDRDNVRQQAMQDQRDEWERRQQARMTGEITQSGGPQAWLKRGGGDWRPPANEDIIWDVEMGEGILLPSVKAKGKDIRLMIPWVYVTYIQPSKGSNTHYENELGEPKPFCQFDLDNWPVKDDFDYDIDIDPYPGSRKYVTDYKKVMQVYESDKNHYHMLRGVDKDVVDNIVSNAVDEWFQEQSDEPLSIGYDDH